MLQDAEFFYGVTQKKQTICFTKLVTDMLQNNAAIRLGRDTIIKSSTTTQSSQIDCCVSQ